MAGTHIWSDALDGTDFDKYDLQGMHRKEHCEHANRRHMKLRSTTQEAANRMSIYNRIS